MSEEVKTPPATLAAKYGELQDVMLGKNRYIVRGPDEDEWEAYTTSAAADGANLQACMRSIVLTCVVWPDRATVQEMIKLKPGNVNKLAAEIIPALAGLKVEIQSKKFEGG